MKNDDEDNLRDSWLSRVPQFSAEQAEPAEVTPRRNESERRVSERASSVEGGKPDEEASEGEKMWD